MKVSDVASLGTSFTRTIIKSCSNVKLVTDNITFMCKSQCKRTGGGIMFSYCGNVYMLTCSHIFPKGNKPVYFCAEHQFDMYPFILMKEMDIEIFKCDKTSHENVQFDMGEYLSNCADISGEYVLITPDNAYNMTDVNVIHESNVSAIYPQVPTVAGKICDIDSNDLHGISGCIVVQGDFPIGIVSNYNIDSGVVKCMHIPFVLSIARLMINRKIQELLGIYINANLCEIEYSRSGTINDLVDASVFYVMENSKEYPGDDRAEIFKKDELILNVNGCDIDSKGLINCSNILDIDMKVSLSAYLMISATLLGNISCSLLNQRSNELIPIVKNVKGLPYSNIFKTYPIDNLKRVIWNNYVFCEMSTELLYNYSANKITVSSVEKNNIRKYYDETRRIILLTHIKTENTDECKLKFPLIGEDKGVYFMTLIKVGRKNVNNIEHLYELLSSYKSNKASFTFTTLNDINKKQKISI